MLAELPSEEIPNKVPEIYVDVIKRNTTGTTEKERKKQTKPSGIFLLETFTIRCGS